MLKIRIFIIPWLFYMISLNVHFVFGGFCQQQAQSSFQFNFLGKVESKDECYKECCDKDDCHISLLKDQHCFGITCTHRQLCQSVISELAQFEGHQVNKRSLVNLFHPRSTPSGIKNVNKIRYKREIEYEQNVADNDDNLEDDQDENENNNDDNNSEEEPDDTPPQEESDNILDDMQIDDEESQCTEPTFKNSIIPKRKKSFTFKKLDENVKDISVCNKKCCNADECLLAFMIESQCYGVMCGGDGSCHTKRDKLSSARIAVSIVGHNRAPKKHHPTSKKHNISTRKLSHHTTKKRKTTKKHKPSKKHISTTAHHHTTARKSSVKHPTNKHKWHAIDSEMEGEDETGDHLEEEQSTEIKHKKKHKHSKENQDKNESEDEEEQENNKQNKKNSSQNSNNKNEEEQENDEPKKKPSLQNDEFGDDIEMLHQLHSATAEGLSQMGDDLMSKSHDDSDSTKEKHSKTKKQKKVSLDSEVIDNNSQDNLMFLQHRDEIGEEVHGHRQQNIYKEEEEKDIKHVSDAIQDNENELRSSKHKFVIPSTRSQFMPMMNDAVKEGNLLKEEKKIVEEKKKGKHHIPIHDDSEKEFNAEIDTNKKNEMRSKEVSGKKNIIIHDDVESGDDIDSKNKHNAKPVGKSVIEHSANTENIILKKIESLEKKLSSKKDLTPTEKHKAKLIKQLHKLEEKTNVQSGKSKKHNKKKIKHKGSKKDGKEIVNDKDTNTKSKKKSKKLMHSKLKKHKHISKKGGKKKSGKKKVSKTTKQLLEEASGSGSGSGYNDENIMEEESSGVGIKQTHKKSKISKKEHQRKHKGKETKDTIKKEKQKHKKHSKDHKSNTNKDKTSEEKHSEKHINKTDKVDTKKSNEKLLIKSDTSSVTTNNKTVENATVSNVKNKTKNILNEKKDNIPLPLHLNKTLNNNTIHHDAKNIENDAKKDSTSKQEINKKSEIKDNKHNATESRYGHNEHNGTDSRYGHREDIFKEFNAFRRMYEGSDRPINIDMHKFKELHDDLSGEGSGESKVHKKKKSKKIHKKVLNETGISVNRSSIKNASEEILTTAFPITVVNRPKPTTKPSTTKPSTTVNLTTNVLKVNTTVQPSITNIAHNLSTTKSIIPHAPETPETDDRNAVINAKSNTTIASKKSMPTLTTNKVGPTHRHTKPLPPEVTPSTLKHHKPTSKSSQHKPTKKKSTNEKVHFKTVPTVAVDGLDKNKKNKTKMANKKNQKNKKAHTKDKNLHREFKEDTIKDLAKEPVLPALPQPKPPKKIPSLNINIDDEQTPKPLPTTTTPETTEDNAKGNLFALHKAIINETKIINNKHVETGSKRIHPPLVPTLKIKPLLPTLKIKPTMKPHKPTSKSHKVSTLLHKPTTKRSKPTTKHHSPTHRKIKPSGKPHIPTKRHQTKPKHKNTTPRPHSTTHFTTYKVPTHPPKRRKTTPKKPKHHPTPRKNRPTKKQHKTTKKKTHFTTVKRKSTFPKKHTTHKVSPTRIPSLHITKVPIKTRPPVIKTRPPILTQTGPQNEILSYPLTTTAIPFTSKAWETLHPTSPNEAPYPPNLNQYPETFGNSEQYQPLQENYGPDVQGEIQQPVAMPHQRLHYLPTTHIPKTPFNKIKKLMALVGINPNELDRNKNKQIPDFGATNPNVGLENTNNGLENMPPDIGEQIYDRLTMMNPNKVSALTHQLNDKMPMLEKPQQTIPLLEKPRKPVPVIDNKPKLNPNILAGNKNIKTHEMQQNNLNHNKQEGVLNHIHGDNANVQNENQIHVPPPHVKPVQHSPPRVASRPTQKLTTKESPLELIHRLLGNDVLPKEKSGAKKSEKLEIIKKPSSLDDFFGAGAADRRAMVANHTKIKKVEKNHDPHKVSKNNPKLDNYFAKVQNVQLNKTKEKQDSGNKKSDIDLKTKKVEFEELKSLTGCSFTKDLEKHIFIHTDMMLDFMYKVKGVSNINSCTKECCQHDACNIAFLEDSVCNLVQCKNLTLCNMVAPTNKHTRLVYIEKKPVLVDNTVHGYCPKQHAVGITWDKTKIGSTVERPCPRDAIGNSIRVCQPHSIWLPPDFTGCISEDYATLSSKANGLGYTTNARSLTKELDDVTTQTIDNSLIFGGDLIKATNTVSNIAKFLQENKKEDFKHEDLRGITRTISNLFDETNKQEWSNLKQGFLGPAKLMKSLDTVGLYVADKLPRSMEMKPVITNSILITVAKLGVHNRLDKYVFPNYTTTGVNGWTNRKDSIHIPKTIFSKDKATLVASMTFKTLSSLLPHRWNTKKHVTFTDGFVVNSNIISCSVEPKPVGIINPPVTIVLNHLKVLNDAETKCVYWDFNTANSPGGSWATDGCWVANSNRTSTTCKCNHLTHFAILSNINNQKVSIKQQAKEHTMAAVWLGIPLTIVILVGALYTCFAWSKTPRRRHVVIMDKKPVLPEEDVVVTQTVSEKYPGSPDRYLYAANFTPSPSELEWEHAWDFLTNSDFDVFRKKEIKRQLKNRLLKQRLRWEEKRQNNVSTESSATTSTRSGNDVPYIWKYQDDNEWSKERIKYSGAMFDMSSEHSQPLTQQNSTLTVFNDDPSSSLNTIINHLEDFSPVAISSPHSYSFDDDSRLYSHNACMKNGIKNGQNYLQISFDADLDLDEEISENNYPLHNIYEAEGRDVHFEVQPPKTNTQVNSDLCLDSDIHSDISNNSNSPSENLTSKPKNVSAEIRISSDSGNVSSFDSENYSSPSHCAYMNQLSPPQCSYVNPVISNVFYVNEAPFQNIFVDALKSIAVDLVETDLTDKQLNILKIRQKSIQDTHIFNSIAFDIKDDFNRACNENCCHIYIDLLFTRNETFESIPQKEEIETPSTLDNIDSLTSNSSSLESTSSSCFSHVTRTNLLSDDHERKYSTNNASNFTSEFSNHDRLCTYLSDSSNSSRMTSPKSETRLRATQSSDIRLRNRRKNKTLIHRTTSVSSNIIRKPCTKEHNKQTSNHASNIRPQTPHMKSYIALRQQCRRNDSQITRNVLPNKVKNLSHRIKKSSSQRKVKHGVCVNTSSWRLESPCKSESTTTSDENSLQELSQKSLFSLRKCEPIFNSKESVDSPLSEKMFFNGVTLNSNLNPYICQKPSNVGTCPKTINSNTCPKTINGNTRTKRSIVNTGDGDGIVPISGEVQTEQNVVTSGGIGFKFKRNEKKKGNTEKRKTIEKRAFSGHLRRWDGENLIKLF